MAPDQLVSSDQITDLGAHCVKMKAYDFKKVFAHSTHIKYAPFLVAV